MILYLNNFKGFSETFIPLEPVNFFVGENSTGKTTVLNVLEILSKTAFWTMPQLSSGEYRLGPFNEVVSQFATDRSYFQIGAEFVSRNTFQTNPEPTLFRVLETFKEYDGNIVLDSIKYTQDNYTYFCSRLVSGNAIVSRSRKSYNTFNEWVYSKETRQSKTIATGWQYFQWLPSLMQIVKESFDAEDNNKYLLYLPNELSDFIVISPIRAEAHRIYESFSQSYSPQGEHIPVVLNKLMHSGDAADKDIIKRLRSFGANSNLFDAISTPRFGSSADSPFTIAVEYGKVKVNLTNVGYGVTQSLPLLVEISKARSCAFSLQQPEVHLHPKAQAAFGEFLYESATKNKNIFFCETHSDFIINRYRYALHGGKQKIKSQVLFFTRDNKGTHVVQIPIDENGHFQSVPDEYMRFFIDEELKMLEF